LRETDRKKDSLIGEGDKSFGGTRNDKVEGTTGPL